MSDLDTIKAILEEREKTHQVRYKSIETSLSDIKTAITSQNKTITSQGNEIARIGSIQRITTWVGGALFTGAVAVLVTLFKGQP